MGFLSVALPSVLRIVDLEVPVLSLRQPGVWIGTYIRAICATLQSREASTNAVEDSNSDSPETEQLTTRINMLPDRRGRIVAANDEAQAMAENAFVPTLEGGNAEQALQSPFTPRVTAVEQENGSMIIGIHNGETEHDAGPGYDALHVSREETARGDVGSPAPGRNILIGASQTTIDVAYLVDSLDSHVARIVGNLIILPFRMLLLQHIVASFRRADYSWIGPGRSAYWLPGNRKEMQVFCGRLLFCCGLECATRMAMWTSEVGILLWWRKRQSSSVHESQSAS